MKNEQTWTIDKLFITFVTVSLFIALILCLISYIYRSSFYIQNLDFRQIYTGASMLLHGNGKNLYSLHDQFLFQKTFILNLHSEKSVEPYLTPPIVAFFLSPLALLPAQTAFLIWSTFNLLIILILCGFILIIFKENSWKLRILICTMLLFNFSVWQGIIGGQVFMFLVASSFFGWYLLRKHDNFWAGLILSLIAVKPYLLPALGIGLFFKRKKAFTGFISGLAILFLISLMLAGFKGLESYIQLLFSIPGWGNGYGMHPAGDHTWSGLLMAYFHLKLFSLLWFTGIGVALTLLVINLKKNNPELFDLQWALVIITMVFIGPHVLPYDLSLLFIAGFALTKYALSLPKKSKERHILLTFPLLGYIFINFDYMFNHIHLTVLLMIAAMLYITFLIYNSPYALDK